MGFPADTLAYLDMKCVWLLVRKNHTHSTMYAGTTTSSHEMSCVLSTYKAVFFFFLFLQKMAGVMSYRPIGPYLPRYILVGQSQ